MMARGLTQGIIPADCWTEPYMSRRQLKQEIDEGVAFWGYEEGAGLLGVMGIQNVKDVTLILADAYGFRTGSQKRGIGARLLSHLMDLASGPVLIGTWTEAVWAIRFYERYGFQLVGRAEKDKLLQKILDRTRTGRLKPPWCWWIRSGAGSWRSDRECRSAFFPVISMLRIGTGLN